MDSVRRMSPLKRAVGLAALAAGLAPGALAQQTPSPAPEQTVAKAEADGPEGVRVFEGAFFKQYNPVTAADIVNRVPGFEIDDGEALRGFGATAGNVLVNGERPSSKVLISEQLKRIPADSVLRVELVSGSASNLDARGQTQLVNVVLKQAAKEGSPTTWVLDIRDIQYSERLGWGVQLTKTFALGETADLTLDFQLPNLRGRTESYEAVRNAAGVLTLYREQMGQPNNMGVQGSGVLKWRPSAQDTVSLNLQVAPTWNTTNLASFNYTPSGAFAQGLTGEIDYPVNYTAEVGGDWEHRFSPELSVKGIALATFSEIEQDDIFRNYTPSGTAGPGGLFNTQTFARTTEAGERVARGFVTWRPDAAHTIDIGVEGAFNFRDTTLDIFNNTGSGPVPQALPVADTRVEEKRIEPFITDVWKMSPQLTLETGFIYEASTITQSGDEVKEREFSYPKPRAILTWQAGASDQVRTSITREVAQLDFSEFATSINVVDASSLIGNPDLEPEKAWKARAEWEHRFGPRAAVTVAVFHDQVEDVQDFIPRTICNNPIGAPLSSCATVDQRTFDAPGNIGDGTRTGIELRGALPLGDLLPNAEVRFSGLLQETEVDDPVTSVSRRFSNERDWSYNISLRHDLPELKLAWGASAAEASERMEYRSAEDILFDRPGTRFDVYVDSTMIPGITVRVSAANIFHPEEFRMRTFYAADPLDPVAPPRATGIVSRTEERKQKGGPEGTQVFSIRFAGSF
jgi:outer membrane receptor protein involved in Fe transport